MGILWPSSMRFLAQAAPWLLFTSPDSTSMQSAGLPKTDIDTSFVPGGTCRPRVGKVGQEPSTYPAAASIVSPANCDTSIASYMTSPIRNSPRVRVPARQAPGTSDPTAVSRIKALTPTHPRMIPAATIPLPAVTRAATVAAVSQRRGVPYQRALRPTCGSASRGGAALGEAGDGVVPARPIAVLAR